MKQMTRMHRAMLGAVCLVAVALVMGWFVGRYIPGKPQEPQQQPMMGLTNGNGASVDKVFNLPAGSTMELRDVTQGQGFLYNINDPASDPAIVNSMQMSDTWIYDCPNIDVSASEIRIISTESFAEWYPEYRSSYDGPYNDSALVAVTLTITNASDERIAYWRRLPAFTLWSENLANIDNTLGAGARLDDAFYFVNDPPESYVAPTRDSGAPNSSTADPDESDPSLGNIIDIEPGESQTFVLPFRINKNNLIDQDTFDNLNPSDFCIQIIDYDPATAYRLWL